MQLFVSFKNFAEQMVSSTFNTKPRETPMRFLKTPARRSKSFVNNFPARLAERKTTAELT